MPLMPLNFESAPKVDRAVFRYVIYSAYTDGKDGVPVPVNTPDQLSSVWQAWVRKPCSGLNAIAVYAVPAQSDGSPAEPIFDQGSGRFTGRFYDWLVLRDEHGAPILSAKM